METVGTKNPGAVGICATEICLFDTLGLCCIRSPSFQSNNVFVCADAIVKFISEASKHPQRFHCIDEILNSTIITLTKGSRL